MVTILHKFPSITLEFCHPKNVFAFVTNCLLAVIRVIATALPREVKLSRE